jgi:hypothetical protein
MIRYDLLSYSQTPEIAPRECFRTCNGVPVRELLSLERCREVLLIEDPERRFTDSHLEQLRDQLYGLARLLIGVCGRIGNRSKLQRMLDEATDMEFEGLSCADSLLCVLRKNRESFAEVCNERA